MSSLPKVNFLSLNSTMMTNAFGVPTCGKGRSVAIDSLARLALTWRMLDVACVFSSSVANRHVLPSRIMSSPKVLA